MSLGFAEAFLKNTELYRGFHDPQLSWYCPREEISSENPGPGICTNRITIAINGLLYIQLSLWNLLRMLIGVFSINV